MSRTDIFFDLMETTYEVSRYVSTYEGIPRKYGTDDLLYMAEAHTINLIDAYGETNLTNLVTESRTTKSATSQMIDKLVRKDLVNKRRNPENNREVIISLTEKGHKVCEFHKKLDKKNYARHLKKLDEFDDEDFVKYIQISALIYELDNPFMKKYLQKRSKRKDTMPQKSKSNLPT